MRPLTEGTLRRQLAALLSMGDPWGAPPGSELWLLLHRRPVTLSREQLEACIAPEDRTVDLATAESWVLTGDNDLAPA
jgi:hypothetical protein